MLQGYVAVVLLAVGYALWPSSHTAQWFVNDNTKTCIPTLVDAVTYRGLAGADYNVAAPASARGRLISDASGPDNFYGDTLGT